MALYRYWQIAANALIYWLITYLTCHRPFLAESLSRLIAGFVFTALLLFVAAHAEDIERLVSVCVGLLRFRLKTCCVRAFPCRHIIKFSLHEISLPGFCFQRPPPLFSA